MMHRLYKESCEERKVEPVSLPTYRHIFCSNFNLGFGTPKSDTCAVCDTGDTDANTALKQRAEQAFDAQRRDRLRAQSSDDIYMITFDLQKTLPLPKLSTSVAFYLRQIWLYNVGIHLTCKGRSQPYFSIWTEADGGRGCSEISSSILAFVDCNIPKGSQLTALSDSCCGQNKNFFTLTVWQYLVKCEKLKAVDHKFPECGHRYLDSDRDFAHIEQKVREVSNVYDVDQYHNIMAQSQQKSKPQISRMQGKLYDVKTLPAALKLTHRKKTTDGSPVRFRDKVRWVRVEEFGSYMFR